MVYGEESKCIKPSAGDADSWIKFWEGPHGLAERNIFGGSGTCKGAPYEEKKDMSQFEKFVTEGNEKADELAKGAQLDEGFMVEARVKTMQQERERRCAQPCSQLHLLG